MACYLTSAIRALPTMTSGIPLVNSRTLFLTQSAAFSFETSASSALSNMLMVISHIRAAIEQIIASEPLDLSHHGHEALSHAPSEFIRRTASHVVFLMLANMVPALAVQPHRNSSVTCIETVRAA